MGIIFPFDAGCWKLNIRESVEFFDAALDSDDLLYLKEQMEAEEDAERLLRRTEKRAFQAFKISFVFFFFSDHYELDYNNIIRQEKLLNALLNMKRLQISSLGYAVGIAHPSCLQISLNFAWPFIPNFPKILVVNVLNVVLVLIVAQWWCGGSVL